MPSMVRFGFGMHPGGGNEVTCQYNLTTYLLRVDPHLCHEGNDSIGIDGTWPDQSGSLPVAS